MAAIPPIIKLCAVLRFLADGSYQKCSGNAFNVGVAESTLSLILHRKCAQMELLGHLVIAGICNPQELLGEFLVKDHLLLLDFFFIISMFF